MLLVFLGRTQRLMRRVRNHLMLISTLVVDVHFINIDANVASLSNSHLQGPARYHVSLAFGEMRSRRIKDIPILASKVSLTEK